MSPAKLDPTDRINYCSNPFIKSDPNISVRFVSFVPYPLSAFRPVVIIRILGGYLVGQVPDLVCFDPGEGVGPLSGGVYLMMMMMMTFSIPPEASAIFSSCY